MCGDTFPCSRLRDLAEIRVSNVDKKTYSAETPVRLCNYLDVYTNDYITAEMDFMIASASKAEIERFGLLTGDVIITKDSETPDDIGIPTVIVDAIDNLLCGYHLAIIRPRNGQIDPVYLAKQLSSSSSSQYFAVRASGSTRFGLSIGAIENLTVPLAPRQEQTKIAEILSTVDRAIEQTEALIAKQRRIKTGLMQDLLTHGIDEHGRIRSEQTHEFKDSPLGRIPKEWQLSCLGTITDKIADRDHTTPEYVDDGVLIISPMAFADDEGIEFGRCPRITRKAHLANCKKTDSKPGDLILHRIGAGLGRVRVVLEDHPEYSLLHSLALVRPNYQLITTSYLKWSLRSFATQLQMGLGTQSIGVPDLGLDKIASLFVKVPRSLNEQNEIGKVIDTQQEHIDEVIVAKVKLSCLKVALMQDLLTGRCRVTPLLAEPLEATA